MMQIDNHLNLDNTILQSQSRWLSVSLRPLCQHHHVAVSTASLNHQFVDIRRQHRASSPDVSVQRWKTIVTAINKDPYARGRVIFDILNEPDAYGLRWEVSKNPNVPSITTNYLRFMDMASKINHSALFTLNTEDDDRTCCIRSALPPAADALQQRCQP